MSHALLQQPFPRRLAAYLQERFPPGAYLPLIVLFHLSASRAAVATGGEGRLQWAGAVVLLLAFFHLRVLDEQKDAAEDRTLHPERLLSRGVVTLEELSRVGLVAVAVQAAVAAALGRAAAVAWAAAFGFSLLMRWEFGLAHLLRPRPLLYALTHNPVVALLAVFCARSAGAPLTPRFGWYVAAVSLASLAFELGRKSERYAAAAGALGAQALGAGVGLGASACLAALLLGLPGLSVPAVVLAAAVPTLLATALAPPWVQNPPARSAAAGAAHLLSTLVVALLGTLVNAP